MYEYSTCWSENVLVNVGLEYKNGTHCEHILTHLRYLSRLKSSAMYAMMRNPTISAASTPSASSIDPSYEQHKANILPRLNSATDTASSAD